MNLVSTDKGSPSEGVNEAAEMFYRSNIEDGYYLCLLLHRAAFSKDMGALNPGAEASLNLT